ncbi:efflux RND transporter permease subunit [Acanthopleuribacter pedis]|uniref:MMPL family transporter n=1 Tax=Acanthopleuribacter pedis TaxID=442870 RepID=A0A8J7PZD2_9BACT|nr:efflux RND transporter permease subunit [Acanthopleuribacter pedis]MBO1317512.1 MMPL family transporter [Acanthopleuribacter pedis]
MTEPAAPGWITRYATAVIRFRFPILVFGVIGVVLLATNATALVINDDYRYFFNDDDPQLLAYNDLQDTYNKNDTILFVVAPKQGGVFEPDTLAAIEALTEAAWQIPFATRVDSMTNYQHTEAEGDELIVADLVEDAASLSSEQRAYAAGIATTEPLLRHRLINPAATATGINVTLELPGVKQGEQRPAVARAREIAATMGDQFPGVDIHLTGILMLNNAFDEAAMHDMATLMPLMFAVIALVMALLLRSVSGTVATLTVVGLSVMAAMGFTAWLGIPMSPPSSIAPTLIMTLAVADSIHIIVSILQQMRAGSDKQTAIIESLRLNMQPVFLTSLTTLVGFLSLNASAVVPLNDLGNITSFGVAAAFLMSVTVLPALVAILPLRVTARGEESPLMDKLADFIIARRGPVLAVSVLVVFGFAAMIPNNELNDEFVNYFDTDIPFRAATDFTTEHLTGIYQIEFSLPAAETGGISEPDYLQTIEHFAGWYRAQAKVVHVDVLSDTMKRLNKNMHGGDAAAYTLPASRELSAQYLLLYEMSLPYGLDLNNRIDIDKAATRFVVTVENASSQEMRDLVESGAAWLRANAPTHMQVTGSGIPVIFSYLTLANSIATFQGTLLAFLLITLTLIISLRSFKYGLISLIPNLVPSMVAFGIWGLVDGQVNFGLTVVSALSIGIVVDDTVHFLSKYLRAKREKGLDTEGAIRYAFGTVGRAITVTTLVLILGFMIMMLSDFAMNEGMGKLTAITLALALITDFFMLPALLLVLQPKNEKASAPARPVPAA